MSFLWLFWMEMVLYTGYKTPWKTESLEKLLSQLVYYSSLPLDILKEMSREIMKYEISVYFPTWADYTDNKQVY